MKPRIVEACGPWRWLLRATGFSGVTMPWGTIYITKDWINDRVLRRHELVHILQMKREGVIRFCLKYLWYSCTRGYWKNPFEVEAYARSHPMVHRPADKQVSPYSPHAKNGDCYGYTR